MHYHLYKFRCPLCTVEQAAYVLCSADVCISFAPCVYCKEQGLDVIEEYERPYMSPDLVSSGKMWSIQIMPGELSLYQLKKKLGIELE